MKKIPCQCPMCQLFAMLAMDLLTIGDTEGAEIAASQITWIEVADETEGYTDHWFRGPIQETPAEELN